MSAATPHAPTLREWLCFVLAAGLAVALAHWTAKAPPTPTADALRYLDYALNLHTHSVFGLNNADPLHPPAPGSANAPLYPWFVSVLIDISPSMVDGFACMVQKAANCRVVLTPLLISQSALVVMLLALVWAISRLLNWPPWAAWLAALWTLASREPVHYAGQVLTENLTMPLFALHMFANIHLWKHPSVGATALAGLSLGLLILNRPEFLYMVPISVLLSAAIVAHKFDTPVLARSTAVIIVAVVLVTAPWSIRNSAQLGHASITSGYGGEILVQRVAYNRMTTQEYFTAYLYWFPDIGDSLAEDLLPAEHWQRLGFGPGTFYQLEAPKLRAQAVEAAGGPEKLQGWLLRHEVLENLPKHVAVTMALLWRGLFISKWWGVIGFACFLACLVHLRNRQAASIVLLSVPAWFMAGLYAFVSVSVPRYNFSLIPVYALATTWVLVRGVERLRGSGDAA